MCKKLVGYTYQIFFLKCIELISNSTCRILSLFYISHKETLHSNIIFSNQEIANFIQTFLATKHTHLIIPCQINSNCNTIISKMIAIFNTRKPSQIISLSLCDHYKIRELIIASIFASLNFEDDMCMINK